MVVRHLLAADLGIEESERPILSTALLQQEPLSMSEENSRGSKNINYWLEIFGCDLSSDEEDLDIEAELDKIMRRRYVPARKKPHDQEEDDSMLLEEGMECEQVDEEGISMNAYQVNLIYMITFNCFLILILLKLLLSSQDIRISRISNGQDGAVEKLSASSSKSGVISIVVVNLSLCKHSKVLNLGSTKWRTVIGDQYHLSLGLAHALECSLVSEVSLAGLHDKLDTGVHVVNRLLLLDEIVVRSLK